ncbi:hypothetical protein MMC29_001310 [Sticta canariensis]|nr:hypothetical protein [Sticta canariensis]
MLGHLQINKEDGSGLKALCSWCSETIAVAAAAAAVAVAGGAKSSHKGQLEHWQVAIQQIPPGPIRPAHQIICTQAIAETSSYQEKLYYFQTQAEIPADIRVPDQGSPPLEAVHQVRRAAGGSSRAGGRPGTDAQLSESRLLPCSAKDQHPSALAGNIPTVPLSWVELPDFQQLRLGINDSLQVVHPSSLPFDWESVPKLELQHAVLWFLTFQDNHGHLLGEHGPTLHTLLCTYLGSTKHEDMQADHTHRLRSMQRSKGTQLDFPACCVQDEGALGSLIWAMGQLTACDAHATGC